MAGFKRISSGNTWFPASHAYGLALAAIIALVGWAWNPPALILFTATTLLFGLIAVWEWGSFHGGWIEPMERRGWWLGKLLRARVERIRARRLAREAAEG